MDRSARKARRALSADGLFKLIRQRCERLPDARAVKVDISLADALLSAFAMFSLKDPSLLAFDERRQDPSDNFHTVYGIKCVPSDTQIRTILDPVDPDKLRPLFQDVFRCLQRGKALESFVFLDGHYLLSLDGTTYFSSNKVHCSSCLEKHHRGGGVTWSHQILGATLVHPDHKVVFHKDEDFAAFVGLMREAHEKVSMRLTGFCLLPDHFHLLLWPREDGDLSRWMQWLMTSHVRRYHRHYKGSGHVWQGRFKAFPVQSDSHYLTTLRYVERNPLRAKMVERSQDWEWSSLKPTARSGPDGLLCDGPILKPAQWTRHVNGVETEAELESLRHSIARGTPFGDSRWQTRTAADLGLESSLRPRGRPRKLNQ